MVEERMITEEERMIKEEERRKKEAKWDELLKQAKLLYGRKKRRPPNVTRVTRVDGPKPARTRRVPTPILANAIEFKDGEPVTVTEKRKEKNVVLTNLENPSNEGPSSSSHCLGK